MLGFICLIFLNELYNQKREVNAIVQIVYELIW